MSLVWVKKQWFFENQVKDRYKCFELVSFLFIFYRYRWNNMPRLEKVYLKNNVMGLISSVSTCCPRLFSQM